MNFAEQLDQFVERGAEEHENHCWRMEPYTDSTFAMAYTSGAASLKPIVLKLVTALENYRYTSVSIGVTQYSIAAETLAEVSKMLEGDSGEK